jgi:DNA adenine methylase
MTMPHPIPYQGSKRQLAAMILRYLPAQVDALIEPFAGSGALSIAAVYQGCCERIILNDINPALMTLWQFIVNEPERLSDFYERLWQAQVGRERSFYDLVRKRFNQTQHPGYFLYLLARCVKASVRYNAQGEFNQSPDNRRKGRQPEKMRDDILQVARLLQQRITLLNHDYRTVVKIATPDDVIYFDPPYQGVCASGDPRYFTTIDYDIFVDELRQLNNRRIPFIVSYDGRTGQKKFGQPLPISLNLTHIELDAGRSSQATLLGRVERTYESLYLSPALTAKIDTPLFDTQSIRQLALFEDMT